jgi:hypothetical protein
MGLHHLYKKLLHTKGNTRMKRQHMTWEKIFAPKGRISKIYKKCKQLISRRAWKCSLGGKNTCSLNSPFASHTFPVPGS